MTTSPRLLAGAVVALSLAAGLAAAQPAHGVALAIQPSPAYGQYLTDGQGRTVYLFTRDQGAHGSACNGACVSAWPPVLVQATPQIAAQVDPKKLGTIRRDDGSRQLTYNGWPLYYYAPDQRAGDTRGQSIQEFGGTWYLVSPSGELINKTSRRAE